MFILADPETLEAQHLHSPKSRQKHCANGSEPRRMLALGRHILHDLPQVTEFIVI